MRRPPEGGPEQKDGVFACLASRLREPLPGAAAHRIAWPADLPQRELPEGSSYRRAAVLLVIVAGAGGFWIPFVERPETMPQHPGQIGLPGGGQNDGESIEDCALREAHEEIGLSPERVQVLGRLSPVTIGVSRFRVEVLVGGVRGQLDIVPQNREVRRLLRGDPNQWKNGPSAEYVRERPTETFRAPAYAIEDALIWGATALMLAEFLWIWNECGPRLRP